MPPREFISDDIAEIEQEREILNDDQITHIVERILEKLMPMIKDFMSNELNKLRTEIVGENKEATDRSEFLKVKKRSWKLLFAGIPEREQDGGDTVSEVVKCCKEVLNMEITPHDIVSCYRMNKGKNMQHRPIVVAFASKNVRDGIFHARKHLRGNNIGIYINELLTKKNANIYFECRQLVKQKKLSSTWTSNGFIFVKKTRQHSEKPLKILSLEDLKKL